MAEEQCNVLDSGTKLGMMLLYPENNQRKFLAIPDATVFQTPEIQSAFNQYLEACEKLQGKSRGKMNKLAYEVFFRKNQEWILKEFGDKIVPTGVRLEEQLGSILVQLFGLIQPSRRDTELMIFTTNPGNLRNGDGKYSGNCVESSLLTSTILSKYNIPHYVVSGTLTQTVPEGTAGASTFWQKGKLVTKIEVAHSFLVVPGKNEFYLYDTGNGIFVKIPGKFDPNSSYDEIGGLGQRKNLGLRISTTSKSTTPNGNNAYLMKEILNNTSMSPLLRGHTSVIIPQLGN